MTQRFPQTGTPAIRWPGNVGGPQQVQAHPIQAHSIQAKSASSRPSPPLPGPPVPAHRAGPSPAVQPKRAAAPVGPPAPAHGPVLAVQPKFAPGARPDHRSNLPLRPPVAGGGCPAHHAAVRGPSPLGAVVQRQAVAPSRGVIQRMETESEGEDSSSSEEEDDSSDESYEPTQKGPPRWTFSSSTVEQVIRTSAHPKKYHNAAYDAVWTCPGCGRPLAYEKNGSFKLVDYTYITKKKGKKETMRAVAMDHNPPWSGRYEKLKSKPAHVIRADHDDPSKLRALCTRCNGSHRYERVRSIPDYDSDTDSKRGRARTPSPERDTNKGRFSSFLL